MTEIEISVLMESGKEHNLKVKSGSCSFLLAKLPLKMRSLIKKAECTKPKGITLDRDIKELIIKLGIKLTDRDEIDMLSEIYPYEDSTFANLLLVDEMLELESISKWVRTKLGLRVSLRRKGRKEIIQVLKNLFVSGSSRLEKTSMALKKVLELED